jgi:anti-sigma regulatory factor (Ser/Thr protein kinase)
MRNTLHSQYLAVPSAPATARRDIRSWLSSHGWPSDDSDDLVLALSEAITNAAEHAYPITGLSGRIELTVTLVTEAGGRLRARATVTDHGRWRIPSSSPGYRGRGLRMMRALTETVELTAGSRGTQVTMLSLPVRPEDTASEPPTGMANEMGALS